MTAVFIIVAVFFVTALGIMIRKETKSMERREINAFGPAPKKRGTRALDGTYILK